jgi:hypothetical protein
MKAIIPTCLTGLLVGLLSTAIAWSDQADFSRYQVIIDRNLFGEPVPEPQPAPVVAPPAPPVRSFVETLRLCGIHEERDSAWVSFVDVGASPNKSYMIKVGEDNGDGVKVVDADVVGGRALLKKGDEEKWLGMETAPASAPVAGRSLMPSSPGFPRTPAPAHAPASAVNPVPSAGPSSSIVERLRLRREALERARSAAVATTPPTPPVAAPTNTTSEVSPQERIKKLREYNMELIRAKGAKGPPIPIQLTPEEDDQLVREGVLAPQPATPAPQPQE